MEINPITLNTQFTKNYTLMLSEYRKNWIGLLKKELNDYLKDFSKFLKDDQKAENYWQQVESFITRQISWCSKTEKILQDYRQEDFWDISNKYYTSVYKDCAEQIDIPVTPRDWEPEASDTISLSIWKFYKRSHHRFLTLYFQTVNKVRSLMKKSPLEMPGVSPRKIFVHLLSARYIQWPFNRKILREWIVFQLETGKIIYELHSLSEKILNTIILGNRELAFSEEGINSEILERNNKLKEIYEAVQESVNSFISKTSLDSGAGADHLEALEKEFTLKWQYCGAS